METEVSFGAWITTQRKALDLTREQLAQRVGCSVSGLRKIEGDERRPSRQMAELLANCLQVPPEQHPTFLQVARGYLRVERLGTPLPGPAAVRSRLAPPRPASNLPTPATPLVGRENELTMLARLLRDPQCRLLTLVGVGGIGKTRLAIEAARMQWELFSDGVYFVPLVPVSSPQLIASAIADSLGYTFSGPVDPRVQLLSYLREKCLLLVLDNLEHLVEGSELLSQLLQQAPGVKLLVTSRERLKLQGEWAFDIQGLPVPPGGQLDCAGEYGAVALFAQSARRAQAGFELRATERPWVVRICQLVEGMPLAIELAAAWVRILACAEIAREIESDLGFLSTAARDMPERHRSLRAVFDHSWYLLSDEERRVLRQLSVFPGTFGREAAEQVAGASLPILSALADKSLLRRVEAGRYDTHELIRQYAATHLADNSPEGEALFERHCLYYTNLLEQREMPLKSAQSSAVIKELTAEIDNVRSAWQWAAEHHRVCELRRMSPCLYYFYETRNLFQEAEAAYRLAVAAAQGAGTCDIESEQVAAIGHLTGALGWFSFRTGKLEAALDLLRECQLLVSEDDVKSQFHIYTWLGYVMWAMGDSTDARRILTESLSTGLKIGVPWYVATPKVLLGSVAHARADYGEAYRQLSQALSIWRAAGDPRGIAFALTSLGATAFALGRTDEAQALLRDSCGLNLEIADRWGQAYALDLLAQVLCAQGQGTQAVSLLHQSLSLSREIGDRWGEVQALAHLGDTFRALGDDAQAWRAYGEAYVTARDTQMIPVALGVAIGIASLWQRQGLPERALGISLQVASHPFVTEEIKARAEQLRAQLEAQLTPQQIESAQASVPARSLDALPIAADSSAIENKA